MAVEARVALMIVTMIAGEICIFVLLVVVEVVLMTVTFFVEFRAALMTSAMIAVLNLYICAVRGC